MQRSGHTLLVVALVVAAAAAVPGGAVAAADGLHVSGDQADDGTVTVTVTENSTAVANASVTVEALNSSTYAGTGTYSTDENGTVGLPAPEQNVLVSVTSTVDNQTASTTLTLAAVEENETRNETAVFGQRVSAFVHTLLANGNMSGQTVAEWVTAHNPGADNRPDHVDAGPGDDGDDTKSNNGEENGDNGNGTGHGDEEENANNGNESGKNGNGNGHGPPG